MSDVVEYSMEIEVTVEKLVAGGDGLARHEGKPVFVRRSAPGDRVRVGVVNRRRDYLRAEVLEVLEPGPGRRQPPCPHFADCGGCDLQHLDDALQVTLKADAVRETLLRIGKFELPENLEVHAAGAFGYRIRNGIRIEPQESGGYAVGYRKPGSWKLVPIESCPVLVPELETFVQGLSEALPVEGTPERLDLAVGDDGRVTSAPVVEGLGHGEVTRTVGGHTFAFDARCFFQGHAEMAEKLAEFTVGEETGSVAWDLYAGVGLFSVPLAERYESVVAIEGDNAAARYARINARRNRARNLEVVSGALDSRIVDLPEAVDRVVVDPPRSGLTPTVVETLLARRPQRLTYVSCHAAALARDLRRLGDSYRLTRAALFDLFPQTGHMEAVVHLERVEQAG